MSSFQQLESSLVGLLGLARRPVAVTFCSSVPDNVSKFEGALPSGCSFWRLAADGRVFSTVPADHYNCPVGSYTHNIDLPESRQSELMGTLDLMSQIGYLKMEEVPGIPRLASTPAAVVYAPLGDAPLDPDVVILAGKPSQMMLFIEAASRAGVPSQFPVLARPTCMALPAAISNGIVTSTGCIGNRVYTDLGDDELYTVVEGSRLGRILEELEVIVSANAKLKEYHTLRREQIATS